jgi:Flp pilus assembly pilin Flp
MTSKRDRFWADESGQDLVEYTLLLAMVCLTSAALYTSAGASISTIWTVTNSNISRASSIAAH